MNPPPGAFAIARLPRIIFGAGTVGRVAKEAAALGRRALVVTGAKSFRATPAWPALLQALEAEGVAWSDIAVDGEPSPDAVDEAVTAHKGTGIEVVIGIGGGSALDAAKAIAGLLPHGRSVLEHLEGVGPEQPYDGPALPLVAVPTTAGTGSEATKNAVLTRQGADGFKKSFRDEQLVARVAIVDPELLASCPPDVVAANGMDAFTQLLESYTSINANPLTDALAWSGMAAFRDGFFAAWDGGDGPEAQAGRSRMAYASLLSGICLAQTGLGAVHGLASPLGAYFPIPHGACCGSLVAAATRANIDALTARAPESPALIKYAAVSDMLTMTTATDRSEGLDVLVSTLVAWTERLGLPRLSRFGMGEEDIGRVVTGSRGSSMKTNPIVLTDPEIAAIVQARL
jgi:alcohol dehydrogenase class IV